MEKGKEQKISEENRERKEMKREEETKKEGDRRRI